MTLAFRSPRSPCSLSTRDPDGDDEPAEAQRQRRPCGSPRVRVTFLVTHKTVAGVSIAVEAGRRGVMASSPGTVTVSLDGLVLPAKLSQNWNNV